MELTLISKIIRKAPELFDSFFFLKNLCKLLDIFKNFPYNNKLFSLNI